MEPMLFNKNRFEIDEILVENLNSEFMNKKFFNSLNEEDKTIVADSVVSKELNVINKYVKKLNSNNFYGDIPKSQGNIKKFSGYNKIKKAIALFSNKANQSHVKNIDDVKFTISTIDQTVKNLETYSSQFEKSFKNKDSVPVLTYNNYVAAVIFMLADVAAFGFEVQYDGSIELKKEINPKKFSIKNKSVKSLVKFNDMCANQKLIKIFKVNESLNDFDIDGFDFLDESSDIKFERLIQEKFNFDTFAGRISNIGKKSNDDDSEITSSEDGESSKLKFSKGSKTIMAVAAVCFILYSIKYLIFFFYYQKASIGVRMKQVSDIVDANATLMERNGKEKGKEIAEKQRKMAEKLKQTSKKIEDESDSSEFNAERAIEKTNSDKDLEIKNIVAPENYSSNLAI